MEFPGKWTGADRVEIKQAFVPHQIARVPWPAMAGKIGRCSAGDDARLQQLAHDHAGLLRLAEPHRDIDAIGHKVAKGVADDEFERQLLMRGQEGGEPWSQHQSRKPGIDIDPELAADRVAALTGFGCRFLQARQQWRHLSMEAAAFVGERYRARRPVESRTPTRASSLATAG